MKIASAQNAQRTSPMAVRIAVITMGERKLPIALQKFILLIQEAVFSGYTHTSKVLLPEMTMPAASPMKTISRSKSQNALMNGTRMKVDANTNSAPPRSGWPGRRS